MARLAVSAASGSSVFNRLFNRIFPRANHIVLVRGCPAGANGNLQCCIIPNVSSFRSTNEQANFEYFKSASVLELSFPPPQASIPEQQQPSEEEGSANALNGLNQYFEDGQFPVGDDGSSLNRPAQPITENSLVSYYGAPVAGPDPWAEALGQSFE